MDGDSKYKMFRNFMVNELKITKEDIEQWTKEAVKKAAEDFIEHRYGVNSIDSYVERKAIQEIRNQMSSTFVRELVSAALVNRIELNVKIKDDFISGGGK